MPDGLILIFGMPRSGTTWIGKLFDSHPNVLYRHEPDTSHNLRRIPLSPTAPYTDSAKIEISEFSSSIPRIQTLKVCGKTPLFAKSYLSPAKYFAYTAGVRFSQLAGRAGIDLNVFSAPCQMTEDMRLVWKSIESVGRVQLVLESIPRSKAILLLRHPCGYIASVLRGESQLRFEDNKGASEDYGILEQLLATGLAREKALSIEYFRSLAPEERLAWRWALFNDHAMRETRENSRCSVVRYEDICADPGLEMRKHFAFVGLDWASQTEAFINQSTNQQDNAYYSVYKDPKLAAERWRSELPAETVSKVMAIVEQTLPGSLFANTDSTGET